MRERRQKLILAPILITQFFDQAQTFVRYRDVLRNRFQKFNLFRGEMIARATRERQSSEQRSARHQRIARVSSNSESFDKLDHRLSRILNTRRYDGAMLLSDTPTDRLAEVEPRHRTRSCFVDSRVRNESQRVAGFCHHEIEIDVETQRLANLGKQ